jgi:uncharacterized membrane protein YqhA
MLTGPVGDLLRSEMARTSQFSRDDREPGKRETPPAPFSRSVGRTRFVVLVAVAAVLLVAATHFVLGAVLALFSVWQALQAVGTGQLASTQLTVNVLEVVSFMLKAVVFYIIGVGFYSLFIAPLNLPVALGVETLNDLESKVVSVIVVIMAVTFLEHFIVWEQPNDIMIFGGTMAVVVIALVLFQFYSHWAKEEQRHEAPEQTRAEHELFDQDHEERESKPEQAAASRGKPRK